MVARAFISGIQASKNRFGLVVLLYTLGLGLALLMAVPIGIVLSDVFADTGFDRAMAQELDLVLLFDMFGQRGNILLQLAAHLIWALPLLFVWKAASGAGLVHALRDGGIRSFWSGVGRYGGPAIGLAAIFAVISVVWLVVVVASIGIGILILSNQVWAFWCLFVIIPTVGISGLAVLDLMHDFARIHLVLQKDGVMSAFGKGIAYPFRTGAASRLYVLWFIPALLLLLAPSAIQMVAGASVAVFVLQQVFLVARTACTVGWIGSEVALFEEVAIREAPLIAETDDRADWRAISDLATEQTSDRGIPADGSADVPENAPVDQPTARPSAAPGSGFDSGAAGDQIA